MRHELLMAANGTVAAPNGNRSAPWTVTDDCGCDCDPCDGGDCDNCDCDACECEGCDCVSATAAAKRKADFSRMRHQLDVAARV